ncbi:MAG: hypothetical protein UW41_C0037G0009 [Candidatus Collierbacteria bacterium GW2011_GWC2_44_18]|uniref:Uncharacterized protein n=1 Tax=Candidatus Collierbacteria bacterium GW2011_GWC2_44_18 TaxID=1618392 RepID=A0A0G1KJX8_9BACT|nr:MAG: hypothetical protein UW41_C0037G0009 [Candidatus Collierbacteria bacterium GW2011_GWC2_44_18]
MKTYKKSKGLEKRFIGQDHDKAPIPQGSQRDKKPLVKVAPNAK